MAGRLAIGAAAMFVVLFGLGLLITHLGPVVRWDHRVSTWFVDRRTPALTRVSYWGTFIANTMGVVVVALIATVVMLVRRIGRMAAVLLCGLAVELTVFLSTNYSVGRPRPSVPHLGSTPSTFSFPSGHAAATLVLYAGIAVVVYQRTRHPVARISATIVAVAFPLWVAFSRVYRGQHNLTDVVAGLLMGAVALALAVITLQHRPSWTTHRGNRSNGAPE